MNELYEKCLQQEKELVFFDGVDEKNDASPIFTHVMQGEGEIGRTAVRYLIDRIRGREVPERTYIPYDIVRGKQKKAGQKTGILQTGFPVFFFCTKKQPA